MSLTSRARAIQRLTGAKYCAARQEILKQGLLIKALKSKHPVMTLKECDAAVCFEELEELKKRWGDIF